MAFIQVIEFDSSRIDDVRKLDAEYEDRIRKEMSASRAILCENRDRPGHFMQLVFFDSYESAMENSDLPLTQELAQKMMALADGAPTFHNLDVVEDMAT
jgi:hypothetical protein